jgi:hypothetical protein
LVLELIAETSHELEALGGDADEDLAAIVDGVGALHVAELFEAIHEASGGSGGVAHLASDVRHGELRGGGEVAQQEELGEGDIVAVQLSGEVQQELTLAEQNEVCQLGVVFGWVLDAVGHGVGSLELWVLK